MVRLTQPGHLFTSYAMDILKLTGISKARMKECQETMPQRLGIGCRNFVELRLLQPVLAQLRQQTPNLLPSLRLIPFFLPGKPAEGGRRPGAALPAGVRSRQSGLPGAGPLSAGLHLCPGPSFGPP